MEKNYVVLVRHSILYPPLWTKCVDPFPTPEYTVHVSLSHVILTWKCGQGQADKCMLTCTISDKYMDQTNMALLTFNINTHFRLWKLGHGNIIISCCLCWDNKTVRHSILYPPLWTKGVDPFPTPEYTVHVSISRLWNWHHNDLSQINMHIPEWMYGPNTV
jgi:hypothetical protein